MRRYILLLTVVLMGLSSAFAVSVKQIYVNLKNSDSPICFNRAQVSSISFPTVFIPEINVQEKDVTIASDNTISVVGIADRESVENITYGACYSSTNTTPTIDDSTVTTENLTVGGKYTINIAGEDLESNVTYYVRPFATMTTANDQNKSVYYGEKVFTFTTYNIEVDLGLSVNWASVNIGSATEDAEGDYYAWGSLKQDELYDWRAYDLSNDDGVLRKYCYETEKGVVDNKMVLDDEDDCAMQHANWGHGWRMPTETEVKELINNTTCECTTQNGNKVFKFTSKTTGNSIVMPATGVKLESGGTSTGIVCMWTRNLSEDDSQKAKYLNVAYYPGKGKAVASIMEVLRCQGMAIRPVRDKKK